MRQFISFAIAAVLLTGLSGAASAQTPGVPPQPQLKVVAGDGRVVLYWDDSAESFVDTRAGINRVNFEGYKVYKATDPAFLDALRITDNLGNPTAYQSVAQYDLVNNIDGYHPASLDGQRYWMGSETGLQRVFEDTEVVNGRTYYYAVVAFTHGDATPDFYNNGVPVDPPQQPAIFTRRPMESTIAITVASDGTVTTGANVVAVTPSAPTLGYIPAAVPTLVRESGSAGGTVTIDIIDESALVPNSDYEITFRDTIIPAANPGLPDEIRTRDLSVRNLTTGNYLFLNETRFATEQLLIKEGLLLDVRNLGDRVEMNPDLSGWRNTGNRSNHVFGFNVAFRNTKLADYRVEFGDGVVARSDTITLPNGVFLQAEDVNFRVVNTTTGLEIPFGFFTNPGIPRDLQHATFVPGDPNIGFVVGGAGIIRRTADAGQTWTTLESPVTSRLNSVFFLDANQGWAVGDNGTVVKTTNGGTSWQAITTTITRNLNDVWFLNATTGFAISTTAQVGIQNQSFIYTTTNGGETWTSLAIANSTTTPPGASVRNLNAMTFTSPTNGFIVGANNELITTTDGGATWNRRTAIGSPVSLLNAISFGDADNGWIVANVGRILRTSNGGTTWATQNSGVGVNLNSVSFVSATHGWAVGANGTIIRTTDGGTTWTTQTSGTTSTLFYVKFQDTNTGYAFGNGPTILRTNDGGANWILIPTAKEFRAYLQPTATLPVPYSDEIYFIEEYNGVADQVTWKVDMLPPLRGGTVNPEDGDVLELITRKPFTSADRYTFSIGSVNVPRVDEALPESALDAVRVVPNPYMVANEFESPSGPYAGQNQLHFTNLPAQATIRIFTITGRLVTTLNINNPIGTDRHVWNMLDKDGRPIAYGVYIYHVEAPGVGEKVGRFAVIK